MIVASEDIWSKQHASLRQPVSRTVQAGKIQTTHLYVGDGIVVGRKRAVRENFQFHFAAGKLLEHVVSLGQRDMDGMICRKNVRECEFLCCERRAASQQKSDNKAERNELLHGHTPFMKHCVFTNRSAP